MQSRTVALLLLRPFLRGMTHQVPTARAETSLLAGSSSSFGSYSDLDDASRVEAHSGSRFGFVSRFVLRRTVGQPSLSQAIRSLNIVFSAEPHLTSPPSLFVDDSPTSDVRFESLSTSGVIAHPEPQIGLVGLIAASASLVMCSRFGGEEVLSGGGPLLTSLGLALLPVLWYLPTALVVAELANAIPCNAGLLMWTNVAFKPFWTFFVVLLTLALNITALAVNAALVTSYLGQVIPMSSAMDLFFRCICLGAAAAVNMRSVSGLSSALQVITVLTLIPITALVWLQLTQGTGIDLHAMAVMPASVNIPLFLTFLAFTHSGAENIGSLVEDTRRPERTMPNAVWPSTVASYGVYLIPFACAITAAHFADPASRDFSAWQPGYWTHIALIIGGTFWSSAMAWAGVFSRFSSLLGTVAYVARQLAGMGTMDAFPRPMSDYLATYHPKLLTPVNSITVMALAAVPFTVSLSVMHLVVLFQVLSSLRALIAVYGAFFILRLSHPTLPRPYRVPLGTIGAVLALTPSVLFVSVIALCGAFASDTTTVIVIAAVVVSAIGARVWSRTKPDGLAGRIERLNLNEQPVSGFLPEPTPNRGGESVTGHDTTRRSSLLFTADDGRNRINATRRS